MGTRYEEMIARAQAVLNQGPRKTGKRLAVEQFDSIAKTCGREEALRYKALYEDLDVTSEEFLRLVAKPKAKALPESGPANPAPPADWQEKHMALEARIAELERNPFRYEGVHTPDTVYDKGAFVTYRGSLWHCNFKTRRAPCDGDSWTLCVKHGRDARRERTAA